MIRRFGEPPLSGKRYTMRPGAYAILPLQKRLLLTAQVSDHVDLQLPGGGIDAGEGPIQALYREVMEETGWHISSPKRLGAFRRFVFMPEYDLWAEKICHIYAARPTRQISDPLEKGHYTMVMDPIEATIALGNDGDKHFVEKYFQLSGYPSNSKRIPETSSGKSSLSAKVVKFQTRASKNAGPLM